MDEELARQSPVWTLVFVYIEIILTLPVWLRRPAPLLIGSFHFAGCS